MDNIKHNIVVRRGRSKVKEKQRKATSRRITKGYAV
jgi:hypothetical protein